MIKNYVTLFASLVFLAATSANAACVKPNEVVALEGVAIQKAIYITPGDFGWVPANGYVPYDVLVLKTPICFEYKDDQGKTHKTEKVNVVQTKTGQSAAALKEGVRAKMTGTIIQEETAHHHQKLILIAESFTLEK